MRIKLVSDIHLEFSDFFIKNDNNYDVLILGGDIMIAQDLHDHPEPSNTADQTAIANGTGLGRRQERAQRFRDFLKRCSFQFPHVLYIAGNHEFYHGKFFAGIDYLREECDKYPNVYFLERDTKRIDDVLFLGATLWTDCNKHDPLTMHALGDMMNDFRIIRNDYAGYRVMTTKDICERHRNTLQYFKTVLADNKDTKCVVVGHHSPSYKSIHPQYAHDQIMNGGYHSDLSEFILDHPQIKLWTHGHTHHHFDYMLGDTRVVCNPRGYDSDGYSEITGYLDDLVLEV
jgi:Icc-related predicted phosphoesterase